MFDLRNQVDNVPLSSQEIQNLFSPCTVKLTTNLLKEFQNFDPVILQLKSWHNYKTKPGKASFTILGNKTLLGSENLTTPQKPKT